MFLTVWLRVLRSLNHTLHPRYYYRPESEFDSSMLDVLCACGKVMSCQLMNGQGLGVCWIC